jgi:hypothetical protein
MNTLFSNRSIARRLQIGVGLAIGLVLGLTLWFNYRNGKTELEQQTNAKALADMRSAAGRHAAPQHSRPPAGLRE